MSIAFVGVDVVPMDTERVLPGQTVLIEHGKIIALGPADRVKIPSRVARVDGRGKFLIPGLADMHAHLPARGSSRSYEEMRAEAERLLFLWLANGVTTIRTMSTWPGSDHAKETVRFKERAAQGELLSPRIYAGTARISPQLRRLRQWKNDSASLAELRAIKADGFDLIKWIGGGDDEYNAEEVAGFSAFVAAARSAGLPVAGHVAPKLAIAAGVASMEHLRDFGVLTGNGRSWDELVKFQLDETQVRATAAALKQAGVWICPTSILYESFRWPPDTTARWPEHRYLSALTIKNQEQLWTVNGPRSASPAVIEQVVGTRRRVFKILHEAGVGILVGTDAPSAGYMVPGFSVHRELEAFVQAGMTPYEALSAATRNVATYFGTSDSTGTIAVGKRADLVLLQGNPLADIRHTARPAGVMIGGRWLDRSELDRRLAPLEGKAY